MQIGSGYGLIPVAVGLLVFGFVYNLAVDWMERNGYDEGYTAILVVLGVAVTLLGVALVDWRAALLVFGGFACSGAPMVTGSWWRHVQARRRNWAAEARDRSAEEAVKGERLLRPLVDGMRFDNTETLRRQAQALDAFQTILRFLESVGARTRPE